jgi:HSP20 family protein
MEQRRGPWGQSRSRDPFTRLIEQVFDDYYGRGGAGGAGGGEGVGDRAWAPPVDVAEHENGLTFYVELPGLEKEDVDVTVENNTLTIRGERKLERGVRPESYHRIERSYGAFSRSFSLPNNVRPDACQAAFKDGVLRIDFPKAEEARPRRIEIG